MDTFFEPPPQRALLERYERGTGRRLGWSATARDWTLVLHTPPLPLPPPKPAPVPVPQSRGRARFAIGPEKAPIMGALVRCALADEGVRILVCDARRGGLQLQFWDMARYLAASNTACCSKPRPTRHLAHRIKALRRWFVDWPPGAAAAAPGVRFTVTVPPHDARFPALARLVAAEKQRRQDEEQPEGLVLTSDHEEEVIV